MRDKKFLTGKSRVYRPPKGLIRPADDTILQGLIFTQKKVIS